MPEPSEWSALPTQFEVPGPFAGDPLAREDLDAAFNQFADGSRLLWLGVFRLPPPSLLRGREISGPDWKLATTTEPFQVPNWGDDGARLDSVFPPPLLLLSITTGETTVARARDVGRPRLHALVGYALIQTGLFFGASMAWEGPVIVGSARLKLGSSRTSIYHPIEGEVLDRTESLVGSLQLGKVSERHQLALGWIYESWFARSLAARFTNLWFAVVVCVDARLSKKERDSTAQLERIREHLLAFAWSQERREQAMFALRAAYQIRNKIVHEGDLAAVSESSLNRLFAVVRQVMLVDIAQDR